MTENTQKSSDLLRIQKKELKEKSSRANELDSAELSPDLNSMGEDLMGSMDPDMFGRSNSAERFKRAWEEEPEERKEQEEEGEEESEPVEEPGGAAPSARAEEKRESESESKRDSDSDSESDSESESESSEAESDSESEPGSDQAEEEPEEPDSGDEEPSEAEDQPTVVLEPDVLDRSQAALEATDTVEAPEPIQAPPEEKRETTASGFTSLLDQGSGFLRSDEKADTAELVLEPDDLPLPELPPGLADLTARLISGDSSRPGYRRLAHLLSRFGAGVLRMALREKVQVYLLPPGNRLQAHPLVANLLEDEEVEGAVYIPEKRTMVVEDSCVARVPRGFHPVLYYFAHAFDHVLGGGEGYASLKSAAVVASYESCRQSLAGHRFADDLAGASPVHYFAQAVESYLGENDSLEPLWSRDDLYDFDRSIYDYVDYLLRRINK